MISGSLRCTLFHFSCTSRRFGCRLSDFGCTSRGFGCTTLPFGCKPCLKYYYHWALLKIVVTGTNRFYHSFVNKPIQSSYAGMHI